MKQITMEFKEYQEDLFQAQMKGYREAIRDIVKVVNSSDPSRTERMKDMGDYLGYTADIIMLARSLGVDLNRGEQ